MMYAVKSELATAEDVKQCLINNSLLDNSRVIIKEEGHIFFPIIREELPKDCAGTIVKKHLNKRITTPKTVRELLKLTKAEEEHFKKSFDTVGSIAIIEVDASLAPREKEIANALLKLHRNITTVLKKEGAHHGVFRTQKYSYLAGKRTKETTHTESGVKIKLNVEDVYFSPRLSTERKRIYKQVMSGEEVLVMFSGCAPYVCVISHNTKAKHVYGVELNPLGHKYALENVKLNKLKNVTLVNADAAEAFQNKKFDRIVMPLPKSADDFLTAAIRRIKPSGIIHFYAFLEVDNIPEGAVSMIKKRCEEANVKCEILGWNKCGQQAPRTFRVCVDFSVTY